MALKGFGVVLDGKSKQANSDLPEVFGAFPGGIGFGFLADFFHFKECERLTRFLGELLLLRRGSVAGNGGEFTGIKPEELAELTKVEALLFVAAGRGELHFQHRLET
jgi:hypothetical protein